MRVAAFVILALAATAAVNAATCYLTLVGSGTANQFLANTQTDQTIQAVLSGLVPQAPNVTVFVALDGTYTGVATSAQIYYATIVADLTGTHYGPFPSATPDGTVLHSFYTEYGLGQSPPGFNGVTPGSNATQVVKVRQTGASGAGFHISGDPRVAPILISGTTVCDTGLIHWYNANLTNHVILTPPANLQTTVHNLNTFDFPTGSPNGFSGIVTAIDQIDTATGTTWATLNAAAGIAILLPISSALAAFEAQGGAGVLGYMFSPAGHNDVSAVLTYHFLACPGQVMLYTTLIWSVATSAGGKFNFTTALGAGPPINNPALYPLQLSVIAGSTTSFTATSFAIQTSPQTVGGAANGAGIVVDTAFSGGVIHGLNGFLLPTAVQLTLDKIVSGLQANNFGVTNFTYYAKQANLWTQFQNIATPNTLFVPSDAAFATAFAAHPTLAGNATLMAQVINNHIVSHIVVSQAGLGYAGPAPVGTVNTVNSGSLNIGAASGSGASALQPINVVGGAASGHVLVGKVSVAQNGMIYPVDAVLLPKSVQAAPTPTPTTPSATPTSGASTMSASLLAVFFAALVARIAA
jgi:uncharacterized surface protein with fasciclin (FAS1) repeats